MPKRFELKLKVAKKVVLAIAAVAAPFAVVIFIVPSLRAQSIVRSSQSKPLRPAFDVASVKPIDRATLSRGHEGHQLDRERFLDRTELIQFIVRAYLGGSFCVMTATPAFGYSCPLLSGSLPSWVKSDMFEIQAKMPPNSVPSYTTRQLRSEDTPELNLMLQTLLEDRFHLKLHWERKELPVYAMTVGKNGPKLKQTAPGGEQLKQRDGSFTEVHGGAGLTTVPTVNGSPRTRFNFLASSMQEAALAFAAYFDRPVLDRTGLRGDYDFVIEYEGDASARIPLNPFSGLTPSALSTALEAIGLKLESTKAPVAVLVIDHVEKPSEN
jgi:uncharacterized protein (TIGR03435 family)